MCVCVRARINNESSVHLYVNVSRQRNALVLLLVMNKASRRTAERQSEAGDLLMRNEEESGR